MEGLKATNWIPDGIQSVVIAFTLASYLWIASRTGIIDHPNERSSHSNPTPRGAGIIYPITALTAFLFMGRPSLPLLAGLTLVAVVGFIDDLFSLSFKIRLPLHFAAAGIVAFSLFQHEAVGLAPALILVFLSVASLNAYNFMDGINGITGVQCLVHLAALNLVRGADFFNHSWIGATVAFLLLNFRRQAISFLGDVGSTTIGFGLFWLTWEASVERSSYLPYLFFTVYAVDTGWTFFRRLIRKENVFQAHREHFYQKCVHDRGWSPLKVALAYGAVQAAINAVVILSLGQAR